MNAVTDAGSGKAAQGIETPRRETTVSPKEIERRRRVARKALKPDKVAPWHVRQPTPTPAAPGLLNRLVAKLFGGVTQRT